MKTTYSAQDKNKGIFTISLEKGDIEQEEKKVVLDYNNSLDIKGFRRGKVPRDVIEKKIGIIKLLEETIDRALPRILDETTKKHAIEIYGQPDIRVTKLTANEPIELEVNFTRMPHYTIETYTGLSLSKKKVTVAKEDIERSLEELRNLGAEHTKVDRESKKGDKVTLDFEAYLNNIPLEGGKSTNHPIILGESKNMFIPGFEDNLIGIKPGGEKEFTLRFPKDYGKKDLANREVVFKAKVHEVHEVKKPKLSDELAKKMGNFESLDMLRTQLEENLKLDADAKEDQRFELELIQALLKKNSFDAIPEEMSNDELERMLHEMKHSIEQQGGKFVDYLQTINKTEDDLKKEFKPKAEERIKTALLLREIAQKEHLQVKPNEVDGVIQSEQEHHKDKPEILQQINSPAYRRQVTNVMTSRNVLQYLKEHNTKK